MHERKRAPEDECEASDHGHYMLHIGQDWVCKYCGEPGKPYTGAQ